MRLRTIWTLKGMTMLERLRRTRDCAAMAAGAKLPIRIRYWVTMMELGHATAKSENIPATPLSDVLNNLRTPKHLS